MHPHALALGLGLALALACQAGKPSSSPEASAESATAHVRQIDAHVEDLRRSFEQRAGPPRPKDVEWVKLRLAHLAELDQYLRGAGDGDADAGEEDLARRIQELDRSNADEVRSLVEIHGWFRISIFGEQADRDAWLLVQHADHDPRFQEQVLDLLAELYPLGETSPANFAYLYDRVAINRGRHQRYGTQGGCSGGEWVSKPIEDADAVDERRVTVGLPPLADYRVVGRQICQGAATT